MQDDNQQPQPVQQPQPQPMAPPQPTNTVQPVQQAQPLNSTPVAPQITPQLQSMGMFERRIGRLGFILGQIYMMLWFIIPVLAYALINYSASTSGNSNPAASMPLANAAVFLIGAVGVILTLPVTISLYVRRLHDIGQSGWLTLLTFVPIVSLGLYLYLLFAPGNDGVNQYGPTVNDNRPLVALGVAKPRQ